MTTKCEFTYIQLANRSSHSWLFAHACSPGSKNSPSERSASTRARVLEGEPGLAVHEPAHDPVEVVRPREQRELPDRIDPSVREPAAAQAPDTHELAVDRVRRRAAKLISSSAPQPLAGEFQSSQRRPRWNSRSGAKRREAHEALLVGDHLRPVSVRLHARVRGEPVGRPAHLHDGLARALHVEQQLVRLELLEHDVGVLLRDHERGGEQHLVDAPVVRLPAQAQVREPVLDQRALSVRALVRFALGRAT